MNSKMKMEGRLDIVTDQDGGTRTRILYSEITVVLWFFYPNCRRITTLTKNLSLCGENSLRNGNGVFSSIRASNPTTRDQFSGIWVPKDEDATT